MQTNKLFASISIIILIAVFSTVSMAQNTSQTIMATVEVTVHDFKGNIKEGEVIIFENIKTKEEVRAISNDQGTFKLELPVAQSYLIKVKGISDATKYAPMDIPALQAGQSGITFNVDIKFEQPKVFTLNDVYFDFGKASITKESYTELKELLEFMKLKKTTVIEIAGHTDNVGEDEANLTLSAQRAESVRNYLLANGIEPTRVTAVGYGETHPVATNDTEEGRKKNRRTEVFIIKE